MLKYTIGAVRKKKSTASRKPKGSPTCTTAASTLKKKKSGVKAKAKSASILALCKASRNGFKTSPTLLSKYGIKRTQLSRKKK